MPVARCRIVALALLLALTTAPAEAEEAVEVLSVASNVYDGWHVLDASIRFAFDEELLDALEHGVQLDIDVLIEIKRRRKWLWDPAVSSHRLGFTLQHHPLTGAFVVTEPVARTRHEFADAREALNFLGTIRNYHLLNAGLLSPAEKYDGYLMARLNIDALPAPLQPAAYVSRKWRVESEWLKWELH
ncbi:MAG: DUF4390 domain-containing protein [Gammaproteobacteria bacterium]|nr:DUF4390 domain-containing protein [Gammaproteobacteria bacterium]